MRIAEIKVHEINGVCERNSVGDGCIDSCSDGDDEGTGGVGVDNAGKCGGYHCRRDDKGGELRQRQ